MCRRKIPDIGSKEIATSTKHTRTERRHTVTSVKTLMQTGVTYMYTVYHPGRLTTNMRNANFARRTTFFTENSRSAAIGNPFKTIAHVPEEKRSLVSVMGTAKMFANVSLSYNLNIRNELSRCGKRARTRTHTFQENATPHRATRFQPWTTHQYTAKQRHTRDASANAEMKGVRFVFFLSRTTREARFPTHTTKTVPFR